MTCSAALNAVASAGVWSLTGDVPRALRQDGVAIDQRLAAQLVTCFGRLGEIASAEAVFEASWQNPKSTVFTCQSVRSLPKTAIGCVFSLHSVVSHPPWRTTSDPLCCRRLLLLGSPSYGL